MKEKEEKLIVQEYGGEALLAMNVIKQASVDLENIKDRYDKLMKEVESIAKFFKGKGLDFWCDIVGCDAENIREKVFYNNPKAKMKSARQWQSDIIKCEKTIAEGDDATETLINLYEHCIRSMQRRINFLKRGGKDIENTNTTEWNN